MRKKGQNNWGGWGYSLQNFKIRTWQSGKVRSSWGVPPGSDLTLYDMSMSWRCQTRHEHWTVSSFAPLITEPTDMANQLQYYHNSTQLKQEYFLALAAIRRHWTRHWVQNRAQNLGPAHPCTGTLHIKKKTRTTHTNYIYIKLKQFFMLSDRSEM